MSPLCPFFQDAIAQVFPLHNLYPGILRQRDDVAEALAVEACAISHHLPEGRSRPVIKAISSGLVTEMSDPACAMRENYRRGRRVGPLGAV